MDAISLSRQLHGSVTHTFISFGFKVYYTEESDIATTSKLRPPQNKDHFQTGPKLYFQYWKVPHHLTIKTGFVQSLGWSYFQGFTVNLFDTKTLTELHWRRDFWSWSLSNFVDCGHSEFILHTFPQSSNGQSRSCRLLPEVSNLPRSVSNSTHLYDVVGDWAVSIISWLIPSNGHAVFRGICDFWCARSTWTIVWIFGDDLGCWFWWFAKTGVILSDDSEDIVVEFHQVSDLHWCCGYQGFIHLDPSGTESRTALYVVTMDVRTSVKFRSFPTECAGRFGEVVHR